MPYYKDTLDGKFPTYSAAKLDDPRFTEISEAEWDVLRQAGSTEEHPYSPYVLNKDAMQAAATEHIPPTGTQLPEPPPSEHPLPDAPITGIVHEEVH